MKRMKAVTTFMVLLAAVLLQHLPDGEAVTCGQINIPMAPCLPFLKSGTGTPPPKCCNGIKSLKSIVRTKLDRQAVCICVQITTKQSKTIRDSVAASLPKKCGVQIDFPVSRSYDCTSIG
ncbi:non-specific lipid-transfer protein A-like [Impatiens glandulifera]|uniref:non-specific lipid-transfer protein A-like n=1 Tax=Impatiens glandulifera TaxID=253017 RepID=UPI001FB052B5|nr:non-specific lipid-transfer protein A-like [Impatiens glandulifera]